MTSPPNGNNGRPKNHVQLALEASISQHLGTERDDEPSWTAEQIEWMQKTFPPHCYRGVPGESLEEHLRYSGVVDFVSARAAHYEDQKARHDDDGPDEAEHV